MLVQEKPIITNSSDVSLRPSSASPEGTGQLPPVTSPTSIENEKSSIEPAQPPSSRPPLSMQPTVTEEFEESIATHLIPASPTIPTPVPPTASRNVATSPAIHSEPVPPGAFPVSDPVAPELSLEDPRSAETTTITSPPPQGPLVAPAPKASIPFISLADAKEPESPVLFNSSPPPETVAMGSKARTPLASPPQSPTFYPRTSRPPSQPNAYPYPYPTLMSNSPYQYAFYPPPFASTTASFVLPEAIVRSGPPGTEDERKMLLEKVSSVLPDINRLLHYYQESQGLLSEKDHLVKQAETQHEEAMNKMRIELIVTKEEYERIIGEQATENLRLKSHSSEQAERIAVLNGLKEEVAALQTKSESMNMELEAEKASYEELKTQKQELEAEVENLKNKAASNHTQHQRLVENLKDEQGKRLAEQEDNHNKALNEQKANLSKIQLDLAGMITKHTQQKKELDSARSVISELENSVAAKSKDLDDALDLRRKELGDAERASEEKAEQHKHEIRLSVERLAGITTERRAEVDAVNASHQKEIEQFQKAAHEERSKLTATFERCETQLQIELDAAQAAMEELRRELDKERDAHRGVEAELTAERDAHDVLKADHGAANKHHAELAESMLSLRSKQAEWQRESERMDRILQSLGQINAHKTRGKGDQFFVQAFEQLASLVEELAKHCVNIYPADAHEFRAQCKEIGILGVEGSASAAQDLRSLVVQSRIWMVLQRRIFEPFLFISEYGALERLGLGKSLAIVAWMIRRKSLRREAIWRSLTMQAVYASAYGRKAAAATAASVTMEIIQAIPAAMGATVVEYNSALLYGVRLVAKAAVQIWRRARLELDSVRSSMPVAHATGRSGSPTDVILWVRPHVTREGLMDELGFGKENAVETYSPSLGSHVLLQGTVLRHDSSLEPATSQECDGEMSKRHHERTL
ncbi:hypothetical protein LTR07_001422 [Exophiala xenobiotica]|nr:hypothetical protein LTR90_006196 [Exophiala xenobiotica]KAK5514522.1 hypothetical protein LTR21_004768 [Exophiala xenobiotica]KAK5525729.1 hypothetical protein LTR07_001422 [Exophiala xenobiotica]